jgi:hypothetical protein
MHRSPDATPLDSRDTLSVRDFNDKSITKVELVNENIKIEQDPDFFKGLPSAPPDTRQSQIKTLHWGNMQEENSSV